MKAKEDSIQLLSRTDARFIEIYGTDRNFFDINTVFSLDVDRNELLFFPHASQ